jgi:hypothetical protein
LPIKFFSFSSPTKNNKASLTGVKLKKTSQNFLLLLLLLFLLFLFFIIHFNESEVFSKMTSQYLLVCLFLLNFVGCHLVSKSDLNDFCSKEDGENCKSKEEEEILVVDPELFPIVDQA